MIDLVQNTNTSGICALAMAAMAAASLRRRGWLILATILATLAITIATQAHWVLHDAIRQWLVGTGLYADHFRVQVAITGGAALVFTLAMLWISRVQHGALRWASLTTTTLIALFLAQAVSIHAVDAVFGRPAGPVMVIAWLWIAGALMIVWAALAARRRR